MARGICILLEQGRVCFEHKDHRTLNINRQAGRRRGRGGQRQGGGNPNTNNGNRIDNRARGNANQLFEKYKALAAEAQRQGDRVNTEYYLQFADHYFRVLAENRSRFEEQNQQRRGREEAFDDEEEGFEEEAAEGETQEQPRRESRYRDRDDRGNRSNYEDRGNREPRAERGNRLNGNGHADNDINEVNGNQVAEAPEANAERAERAPRKGLRPRREPRVVEASEGETFDASLLPPSLGISAGTEAVEEEAPKPRRRRTTRAAAAEPAADAAE